MFEKGHKKWGGRKRGSFGNKTLITVDNYVRRYEGLPEDKLTPLRVMLENMEFYHTKAHELGFEILNALQDRAATPEQLLKFYGHFSKMRDKAQEAAADAAPYCHPKLNIVGVRSMNPAHMSDDDLIKALESAMPGIDIEELAREIEGEFSEAAE